MERLSSTSAPTTAQSACERCHTAEVFSIEWQGVVARTRFCGPCLDAINDEDEERDRRRLVDTLLDRAGAGTRMRGWSLASYPDPVRRLVADEWITSYFEDKAGRHNLILTGGVGVGKTGLAWGIVRALCEVRVEALLVNFRDLLSDLRLSYQTNEPCVLAERAQYVPVLALDDLGAERPTDWAREQLALIVSRRHENKRPIVVTSNYSVGQLAARIGHDDAVVGQRIVSRLTDGAAQFNFGGADRRRAA